MDVAIKPEEETLLYDFSYDAEGILKSISQKRNDKTRFWSRIKINSKMLRWTSSRLRKVLVISSVMAIVICFAVFILVQTIGTDGLAIPKEEAYVGEDEQIRMVHMVFRHGQRTPADTYPNDIYVNHTFAPYGWGQLTNFGKETLYEIGEWARKRYGNLIGDTYHPSKVHAQSTATDRTKMSIELVLASLWPPQKTALEWNKNLNWQPVPFVYQDLDEDNLLLVRVSCPGYYENLHNVFQNEKVKETLEKSQPLFDELTKITGFEVKSADDVQSLYSTLKAEKEFGLKLPEWTAGYYPEKLEELTDLSYILNVYTDDLKKVKGGPWLKKTLNEWKGVASNNTKDLKKIYLYAGHDSSVVNILSAFNVWKSQFPDYAIMGVFELYENVKTGKFSVQIMQKLPKTDPEVLQIPGCESLCPLDKLESLVKNHIPDDLGLACKAKDPNFTEPPPSGP